VLDREVTNEIDRFLCVCEGGLDNNTRKRSSFLTVNDIFASHFLATVQLHYIVVRKSPRVRIQMVKSSRTSGEESCHLGIESLRPHDQGRILIIFYIR
jgi:hypothetical protein